MDDSPIPPIRKESFFKSTREHGKLPKPISLRPIVLPVPPKQKEKIFPRFDVSDILKNRNNLKIMFHTQQPSESKDNGDEGYASFLSLKCQEQDYQKNIPVISVRDITGSGQTFRSVNSFANDEK